MFSFIILFHELGHFLLAKFNGVTVLEFSLGLGPRLLHKEFRGTKYSLKLLPFGGSCMMLGEDEGDSGEGSFGSKSVLARMSIIAAGPIFNFILAFFCSVFIIAGMGYDPAEIQGIVDGYPAQEAGLQAGDTILKLNGKRIHISREVTQYLSEHRGEPVTVTYRRDGETYTALLEPKVNENGRYIIGIDIHAVYRKGGIINTLRYSAYEVKYWIETTLHSIRMLTNGEAGIQDMSGPVGVVEVIGETYTESVKISWFAVWINMLNMAVLLSANLGVMNLLPIPALDGGRLVFLIIELIRGKRVKPEYEGWIHLAGLAALLVLMVFVMFQDVMRLF